MELAELLDLATLALAAAVVCVLVIGMGAETVRRAVVADPEWNVVKDNA
jgi:hypothetical protein